MLRESDTSTSTPSSRILIVDDESDLRQALEELLSSEGFQVDTAASGHEALKRISEKEPDLLLLDWIMPSMGGHELLKTLEHRFPKKRFPVLVMSAGNPQIITQARPHGDEFLKKPFEIDELMGLVKRLSERKSKAS